jgi:hypothetical protein
MRNIRIPVTVIAVLVATLASRRLGSLRRTGSVDRSPDRIRIRNDHRVFIVKE